MSASWHFPTTRTSSVLTMCAAVALFVTACSPADVALSLSSESRSSPTHSNGSGHPRSASNGPSPRTSAPATTTSAAPTTTSAPVRSTRPRHSRGPVPVTTTTPAPTPSMTPAPPSSADGGVGLPSGSTLRASGSITIRSAGQVVENLDVAGTIEVAAANVIIRNSRITGSGQPYGIIVQPGASVSIDHTVIRGNYQTAGFRGANLTIKNSEITGMTNDAGKIENNNVIANNVIHDFAPGAGAHSDGLQMETPAGNVTISGNTILMPGRGAPGSDDVTGALFIVPQLTSSYGGRASGPVVVEDNTLGGGGYTAHFDSAQFPLSDLRVTGNKFMDDSAFGAVYPSGYRPAVWTGNVTESGATVAPPT